MPVTARFVTSAANSGGCPQDGLPEVVFVGRSNVGKSSLVNTLAGARIARTSGSPGKTRLINFYSVRRTGVGLYLVDLPGFGYARGGAVTRQSFDALAREYFSRTRRGGTHPGPDAVLLLVDARHPGLAGDLQVREWLEERSLPVTVVATKIDKLTRAERPRVCRVIEAAMNAPVVPVSTATGEGMKRLWTRILAHARPAPPPPRNRRPLPSPR